LGKQIWERFTPHYAPIHGSWLNQAAIEIGLVARQCLGRRSDRRTALSPAVLP
jgi:hypothetical protein